MLGVELGVPLERTLSCMNPITRRRAQQPAAFAQSPMAGEEALLHCGACSKCRERQEAFREAGVDDSTSYRNRRF